MNMPSLSALTVLDALARTGSVREAAKEVKLSQSAVSHKLKALETRLGFQLTRAKGRGVVLTGEARRYVEAIRPALAVLRAAHRGRDQARGSLDIAVSSGFAATWLASRLSGFLSGYPEVSLKLRSVAAGEKLPECDLGIVFTDQPPEGADHLQDVSFFPVCSPGFLSRNGPLTLSGFPSLPLLHLNTPRDWQLWLEAHGEVSDPGPERGTQAGLKPAGLTPDLATGGALFTGLLAMYAAAEAGLGLCLGDGVTCGNALRAGRLVRPFGLEHPARAAYWLTAPSAGLTAPAAAFADWLREEVAG